MQLGTTSVRAIICLRKGGREARRYWTFGQHRAAKAERDASGCRARGNQVRQDDGAKLRDGVHIRAALADSKNSLGAECLCRGEGEWASGKTGMRGGLGQTMAAWGRPWQRWAWAAVVVINLVSSGQVLEERSSAAIRAWRSRHRARGCVAATRTASIPELLVTRQQALLQALHFPPSTLSSTSSLARTAQRPPIYLRRRYLCRSPVLRFATPPRLFMAK
jgi:hypothetical protein